MIFGPFWFMFMWPITVLHFAFTVPWSQQYLFYCNYIFISYINFNINSWPLYCWSVAVDEVANARFSVKDDTKYKMLLILLKPEKPNNYSVSEVKTDWNGKKEWSRAFQSYNLPRFWFYFKFDHFWQGW